MVIRHANINYLNYLKLANSRTYALQLKKCQSALKYAVLASKCSGFPKLIKCKITFLKIIFKMSII